MKRILFGISLFVVLLSGCQSKSNNDILKNEFEEQGWVCSSTSCEKDTEDGIKQYNLNSTKIFKSWDTYYGDSRAIGSLSVYLNSGNASTYITLYLIDTFTFSYTGNIYTGQYTCETNDSAKLLCNARGINQMYDEVLGIINDAGLSLNDFKE